MTQLSKNTERFVKKIKLYGNCCLRLEQQYASKKLLITDVELVYSSSFLAVCSLWEAFMEDCLFEVVCGTASPNPKNVRVATFASRKHLEKVLLFPNKDYISISSVKQAEALAKLFVENGMPMAAIDEPSRTLLQHASWIRNAIAHQSTYAMKVFQTKVPGVAQLQPNKRIPGAFLRHEFRQAPDQKRYEIYFAAFQRAARDMAKSW